MGRDGLLGFVSLIELYLLQSLLDFLARTLQSIGWVLAVGILTPEGLCHHRHDGDYQVQTDESNSLPITLLLYDLDSVVP